MSRDVKPSMRGPRPFRKSLAEEIIELDTDLIQLLGRRAKLMSKVRWGKEHALTPAAIRTEKQIRNSWEAQVLKLSKDPQFSRTLFNVIQNLQVQIREEEKPLPLFNLAPARQPVNIDIPGPALQKQAMLWIALAAATGEDICLEGVGRSQELLDCVKAFNQIGTSFNFGSSCLTGGRQGELSFFDKAIYTGESCLSFYLLAMLGLKETGKIRFTGGQLLKNTDFSVFGKLVPLLGARFAPVMSGSKSLPAALECSGVLPESLDVPSELPLDVVLALFLAGLLWGQRITMDFSALPAETAGQALSLLGPVFHAFPEQVELDGTCLYFSDAVTLSTQLPKQIAVALEPVISAYLLVIPLFTGGEVKLRGEWPDSPAAHSVTGLLKKFGLRVSIGKGHILSKSDKPINSNASFSVADLAVDLYPLFLVVNANFFQKQAQKKFKIDLKDIDLSLAQEFMAQLDLDLCQTEEGSEVFVTQTEEESVKPASRSHGWNSPGAYWTLALSLAAFNRKGLKLVNPDSARELIPEYWSIYNTLPNSVFQARGEKNSGQDKECNRRRIKTSSVIVPEEER